MKLYYLMGYTLVLLGASSLIVSLWFVNTSVLLFIPLPKSSLTPAFNIEFLLDNISMLFFGVLLVMTGSVVKFGASYMEQDSKKKYFMVILISFVMSMVMLLFTPSLFWFLVGWDGLGVTSFLLINYYKAKSSYGASVKTYLMNRLGDGLLLASFGLLVVNSLNFLNLGGAYFIFVFLMGLYTKSAHFPFGSWLPEAMAAPTPVSALVHSSTLVTAGLYVLIRVFPCINNSYCFLLSVLGLWTLFMASFAAMINKDSKKIMAFSTMSQLGLMTLGLSLGSALLCFSHLMSHAVFKALLFMKVGFFLIMKLHGQDARAFNLSGSKNPWLSLSTNVSIFSLFGFMYLAGFYSKDMMLEFFAISFKEVFYLLFQVSLLFTVIYSLRLGAVLTTKGKQTFVSEFYIEKQAHSLKVAGATVFLILLSLFSGFMVTSLYLTPLSISFFKKVAMLLFIYTPIIFFVSVSSHKSLSKVYASSLTHMVYLKSGLWLKLTSLLYYWARLFDWGWVSQFKNSLSFNSVNNPKPDMTYSVNTPLSYNVIGLSFMLLVSVLFLIWLNSKCCTIQIDSVTLRPNTWVEYYVSTTY